MGDEGGMPVYERPRIEEIGTLHELTRATATAKVNTTYVDTFGTANAPVQIQLS